MVTSNLLGGLGNFMFQMTAAYGVAKDNNDVAIFNINDSTEVHRPLDGYLDNILRNINFVTSPLPVQTTYGEPTFTYLPVRYGKNLKLHGYYQSEKYFNKWRNDVLELYSMDEGSKSIIEKEIW